MEIITQNWVIKDLLKEKDNINPKPQYQISPVWNDNKKQLLIDSILRGYDLPKFYIRRTPKDKIYEFEVIDGQQRMRAIWEFLDNRFYINNLHVHGIDLNGKYFKDFNEKFENDFKQFKLSFTLIEKATQEEIRSLFARLQMGVSLNPAELRHAIASNLGNIVQMTVENHKFFSKECKIKDNRYTHQDYLDHVVAMIFYGDKYDLKAPQLKKMYEEYSSAKSDVLSPKFRIINDILDWMYDINSCSNGIFKNKWGFVDTFHFLNENYSSIETINANDFANNLVQFDKKRKVYNIEPEKLIEDKTSKIYDKDMYDYISAFNIQGGLINNIKIRSRVFEKTFNNKINLNYK